MNEIASATWSSLRHLVYYSKSSGSTTYSNTVRRLRCEHKSDRRVFPNSSIVKNVTEGSVAKRSKRTFYEGVQAARETIIEEDYGEKSRVR